MDYTITLKVELTPDGDKYSVETSTPITSEDIIEKLDAAASQLEYNMVQEYLSALPIRKGNLKLIQGGRR